MYILNMVIWLWFRMEFNIETKLLVLRVFSRSILLYILETGPISSIDVYLIDGAPDIFKVDHEH